MQQNHNLAGQCWSIGDKLRHKGRPEMLRLAACVQSDKVLQSTIESMKELERRCGTAAEQGDMLAGAVGSLEHRIALIQRAIMLPQQGGDGKSGLAGTLRGRRRELSPEQAPTL
jgi:hypothetical protein